MLNLFNISLPDVSHPPSIYTTLKDFAPVIISIVVGAFATFLAWRQWRLATQKLNLDLFDKRIAAYNGFRDIVRNNVGDERLSQQEYSAALQKKEMIAFLFPPELQAEFKSIENLSQGWASADKRWQAIQHKDYEAEQQESSVLSLKMRELRESYDEKIQELPAKLATIMNFEDIRR